MRKIFKLKVLTPMFMGGADPEGIPELRSASIRGVMRFWFRAMAGAVTSNPGDVYRLESEVFGNTDKRSGVVVWVIYDAKNEFILKRQDPLSEKGLNPISRDFQYLVYLANMGLVKHYTRRKLAEVGSSNPPGFYWNRGAFLPQFTFLTEITGVNNLVFKIAIKVFKISVYLGGFGTRWRRGFGGCEIVDESSGNPMVIDLDRIVSELQELITELASSLKIEVNRGIESLPDFPIFHPDYVEVWEGTLACSDNSWETCLNNIGRIYRKFRLNGEDKTHTKDYLNIIKPIFMGRMPKPKNSKKYLDFTNDIFGLPLLFRSRTFNRSVTLNVSNKQKDIGRRASPLILHVEPDKKLIRATLFISKFIPDDAKYFIDETPNLPLEKPREEDFDRIREFLGPSGLGLTRRYLNV